MSRLALGCLFVLTLAGCSRPGLPMATEQPSTASKKHDGEPRTDAERKVKQWLRDRAKDPISVQLIGWGPNDEEETILRHLKEAQKRLDEKLKDPHIREKTPPEDQTIHYVGDWQRLKAVVRLRYRLKNDLGKQPHDELFYVFDEGSVTSLPNPNGDHWLEAEIAAIQAK
jgi:hypothetical protein